MNRPIKLRVWDSEQQIFVPLFTLPDASETRPVVEFTGVYDAAGREIWEGDILYWQYFDEREDEHFEAWHEVSFHCGAFGTWEAGRQEFEPFCNLSSGDLVVGSIFANADLLQGFRAAQSEKSQGC